MRLGQVTGHLELTLEWGAPHGGTGVDTFSSPAPGQLVVHSRMHMADGRVVGYRTFYRRRK